MTKAKTKSRPDLQRAAAQLPPRLVLHIEAPRKRFIQAALRESFIIGRMSEEDTAQPDIDLSDAGAKEAGVSRLHARISIREEMLFIEDLQSTNGTRINGVELEAGKSYRLTPSDEIEVGSMLMNARIVST
jgi:pSer/pThr/pTyr-binding forkhead associated (FHA) protein